MDDNEIHQMLGKILANQESLADSLQQHMKDLNHVRTRVHKVESKINYAGGAIAVVSGIFIMVFGGLWK